jgi:hypothetical protein
LIGYLYRPYTAHTVWARLIYRWQVARMGAGVTDRVDDSRTESAAAMTARAILR